MYRFFLVVLFLSVSVTVFAKKTDSLFVTVKNDKWYITHTVRHGEDVFLLARRYHVPPATLADVNAINYQTSLGDGRTLLIPLGNYNEVNFQPSSAGYRNLYYRVTDKDNLMRISHNAGVQQLTIQQWNRLPDNNIEPGKLLFVGWVLYDSVAPAGTVAGVVVNTKPGKAGVHKPDTMIVIKKAKRDTLPAEQRIYMSQTDSGQNISEERGSAVFFGAPARIRGTNMYYAFHNTAPKGTVIKVHNPGNDKTVYVKVLGPIPDTKQYYNSVIGINSGAKAALGIRGEKGWVELSYAAN